MAERGQPTPIIKKVIKKGHAGHHGGAWKVAYADFVTAMMALFMVLWIVGQSSKATKEAIADYFRAPGTFPRMDYGLSSWTKKGRPSSRSAVPSLKVRLSRCCVLLPVKSARCQTRLSSRVTRIVGRSP